MPIDGLTHRVYISEGSGSSVAVVEGGNETAVNRMSVAQRQWATGSPRDIAVSAKSHRLYLTDIAGSAVRVVDTDTFSPVATIAVGRGPDAVAVDSSANLVYVANEFDGTVSVIDGADSRVLATVPVGHHPVGLAAQPVTTQVYVASRGAGSVAVVDGLTRRVVGTLPVPQATGVAVNPVTGRVYVGSAGSRAIFVFDAATHRLLAVKRLGFSPWSLDVDARHNTVYATSVLEPSVSVLDGTGQVLATQSVPGIPYGIAADRDSSRVYVTDPETSAVYVIWPTSPPRAGPAGGPLSPCWPRWESSCWWVSHCFHSGHPAATRRDNGQDHLRQ